MRLWDYRLVNNGLLPKSQLLGLWRELNSIYKKEDKHILINYIYEYDEYKTLINIYSNMVLREMFKRGIKVTKWDNYFNYFETSYIPNFKCLIKEEGELLWKEHNDRYLFQCFFNLQEKYDRGQKDFSKERYEMIEKFVFDMGIIKER